jgi:hypothetical protein
MKTKPSHLLIALALLELSTINSQQSTAHGQGTAFTYQGQLNSSGSEANGSYDFQFILFNVEQFGFPVGPILTNSAVPVINGLFSATLDFGVGVFTGTNLWLDISVRTNGSGAFTELLPRQALLPTPYAIMANSASNLLGPLPAAQLSGTIASGTLPASPSFSGTVTANAFSGNGANVANVNATALNGLNAADFWQLGGNDVAPGQFLGSANNEPVELWANGARVLRLEPGGVSASLANGIPTGAPNLIGGSSVNFVESGVVGATIGGGGATDYGGSNYINSVIADFGTVGGGDRNTAGGWSATVGGGYANKAYGSSATVGGGFGNTASGNSATVPGGSYNQASGSYSFAAGQFAQASNQGAFVWADSQIALFASTANDQFSVRANGGVRFVTGGAGLFVQGGGGVDNPQAWVDQQTTTDYSRLRFTVGADVSHRWDVGATWTNFTIWSETFLANMIYLDQRGLTVNGTLITSSDRNVKEGFEPVDARSVLERVAALPITRWHFTNDTATAHLGPMAQDFYAAFNVGGDDKHIAVVDEGGVALAAIQGLNEKLEQKEARIQQQAAEIQELKQGVADLKKMVQLLAERR